ncbi:MAG: peptidylprolyl isomerase [Phycisphaerales bacterium]
MTMRRNVAATWATAVVAAAMLVMTGCATQGAGDSNPAPAVNPELSPSRVDMTKPVNVAMDTTAGTITLELDPVHAPISTKNFLEHAAAGHYDGTVFHRVIPAFVVQGGGWTPALHEKAKDDIAAGHPDVPIKNEWQNGLKNTRGTIAMAREEQPDTATREFYINVADNTKLDTAREKTGNAGYAVFGRVVGGWETLEIIRTDKTGPRPDIKVDDGSMEDVPVNLVVIERVRLVK